MTTASTSATHVTLRRTRVRKSNINGDATDPQEGSSSSGNTAYISITDHDEVPRLLQKLLELTTKDLNTSTSQDASTHRNRDTPETIPSGHDESTTPPDTTATEAQPTGSEQERATRMRTRANGAVAPRSHPGLNVHQHRELLNLRLLANPATCNADVAHEM